MPYVLALPIRTDLPGLWGEGSPYSSEVIYDIQNQTPNGPPIHYESHTLKPHSIAHFDAPGHIVKGGDTVDRYFEPERARSFYGPVTVIRLKGDRYIPHSSLPDLFVWSVTKKELQEALSLWIPSGNQPNRLLLTTDSYPSDSEGWHRPNYVLVLAEDAANWLAENKNFCLYGTSWKSTDFQPGQSIRPIHKIFFQINAALFECLSLRDVPEGQYIWVGFPLPLAGATESPACPVLFTLEEWEKIPHGI